METLLSVPPALVPHFNALSGTSEEQVFVTNDPPEQKLGSGGGTAHLVVEAWKARGSERPFEDWAESDKRMIIHAGGQSRRLPAYAPSGKALIPVPVFRWMSGQRINQTLLDLHSPLLKALLNKSSDRQKWIVASGDAFVWHNRSLPEIPDVDVACVGLPEATETASHHGVFFSPRQEPTQLQYMLQKPSPVEIAARSGESLFLIDVGIWILSTRAMQVLLSKSGWQAEDQEFANSNPDFYDLYGAFGPALGSNPTSPDSEVSNLSTAVIRLQDAEFYHYGSSSDIIRSSLALQNRVRDPQRILSPLLKPHPSIFIQNSKCEIVLSEDNHELWIENSVLNKKWALNQRHVLTGIPEVKWGLRLRSGICIDIIPTGKTAWILRPYGFNDPFKGAVEKPDTVWMGTSIQEWCQLRGIELGDLCSDRGLDIQELALFPRVEDLESAVDLLEWIIDQNPTKNEELRGRFISSKRFSADAISDHANLERLFSQKNLLLTETLPVLAENSGRNVFHQIDLHAVAQVYAATSYPLPQVCPDRESRVFPFIKDRMFRSVVERLRGENGDAYEREAFESLREMIIAPYLNQSILPTNQAMTDQVIWSRSPVRLDLAGGWTDTPPNCFFNGGRVVNLAAELNGQPPIQVFLRTSNEPRVVVRSIDLGVSEVIETYDDISAYAEVGSGFSIPKAALALAGFHPDFYESPGFPDLKSQLESFGGGIDITLLCAVPKGSGLGTSSILAATLLGALSELCGLGWNKTEIGQRTSVIEQMLTTGGGWQDQYGGIFHGVKLLETLQGPNQIPEIRWLPDHLFTDPAYTPNLLLYYTGITRVAKDLLGEIVRGMFLNKNETLSTLNALYHNAEDMCGMIQTGNFEELGRAIQRTWMLNQQLDSGTNPPEVQKMLKSVDDWLLGGKLLGAGGGGYLFMLAKDAEAAVRIRKTFGANPPNATARFVNMNLSKTGLKTTRS